VVKVFFGKNIIANFRLILLAVAVILSSCASVEDLPASADQVDFSLPDGPSYDKSWFANGYQVTYNFPSDDIINFDLALRAAKAGVVYAGLDVMKVDIEKHTVVGHRGASPDLDHTIEYVGVYVANHNGRMIAKIYVSGETSGRWGNKRVGHIQESIKKGMDIFLKSELQILQDES
jgi:hypothetical protein